MVWSGELQLESLKSFSGQLLSFTKHFDFDHIYGWLILDFLFIFNTNAYHKLLGHRSGIPAFT